MKKFISVLLIFAITVTVFTACSKNEEKETEEIQNSISFTVDAHYDDYDESSVSAYEKLCQAVINGETEVKFNTSLLEKVNQLFYTCFPLYSLVESIEISADNTGYEITYKNSAEEHKALVKQFNDKILSIMQECGYKSVSINTYIFNVYTYITSNFTADDTVLTVFDAVIQGKGYTSALSSLFEYLVLQGGGKANHVIAVSGVSLISRAQINGTWYYFDPYSEITDNQGKALKYFAMSDTDMKTAYTFTDNETVEETGDGAYDKLRNSVSFEKTESNVSVTLLDGETFELEIV